jgi:hypothetical protein
MFGMSGSRKLDVFDITSNMAMSNLHWTVTILQKISSAIWRAPAAKLLLRTMVAMLHIAVSKT